MSDSRRLVNYYRPTRDGRIVFGKGGGLLAFAGRIGPASSTRRPAAPTSCCDHLHRTYPQLRRRARRPELVRADRLRAGRPAVPPPPAGCARRDRRRGLLRQRRRARRTRPAARSRRWRSGATTSGRRRCWRAPPAGRLPPEPATWAGGQLVKRALRRKEDAEDRGEPHGSGRRCGSPRWIRRASSTAADASQIGRGRVAATFWGQTPYRAGYGVRPRHGPVTRTRARIARCGAVRARC